MFSQFYLHFFTFFIRDFFIHTSIISSSNILLCCKRTIFPSFLLSRLPFLWNYWIFLLLLQVYFFLSILYYFRYFFNKFHFLHCLYRVSQNSRIPNSERCRGSLQWSKYGIKKKSGLSPQRYIDLKVHSLNCVFFKYRLKSSVFIVIYGVDDCGK
jgi:hypothetical protein